MDFDFWGFLINTLMFISALFLILLVLVQRGRGGGLAGALGGMGGQSAFGTKAGDVFTRITIVTAAIWIILCAAAVKWHLPEKEDRAFSGIEAAGPAPIPQPGAPAVPAAQPTATAPAATPPTGGAAEAAAGSTPATTPPAATVPATTPAAP
jgi:preprotein translocase subunit SecG